MIVWCGGSSDRLSSSATCCSALRASSPASSFGRNSCRFWSKETMSAAACFKKSDVVVSERRVSSGKNCTVSESVSARVDGI